MTNPLLSTAALPEFAAIHPEHVQPAIQQLLAEAQTRGLLKLQGDAGNKTGKTRPWAHGAHPWPA